MATIDLGREFVDGIMARRPEALEGLLRVHGPEVQAVAFLIVRNELDAEEIAADTLMTAWRKIGTLRDPDRLSTLAPADCDPARAAPTAPHPARLEPGHGR